MPVHDLAAMPHGALCTAAGLFLGGLLPAVSLAWLADACETGRREPATTAAGRIALNPVSVAVMVGTGLAGFLGFAGGAHAHDGGRYPPGLVTFVLGGLMSFVPLERHVDEGDRLASH